MPPGILAGPIDVELVMGVLDHGDAKTVGAQQRDHPRQEGGLARTAPACEAYHFHSALRAQRFLLVMPGLDPPAGAEAPSARRRSGHPRLAELAARKAWMAGSSPAMTKWMMTCYLWCLYQHERNVMLACTP